MPATEPIRIGKDTKEELKRLKIHPRETYDDVIKRLIEEYKRSRHEKDQRSQAGGGQGNA
jgi:predicted CopG family antitoxin